MAIDFRSIAEFADRDPDFYWSRTPGRFVSAATGDRLNADQFFDTIAEWYEKLGHGIAKLNPEGTILLVGWLPMLVLEHSKGFLMPIEETPAEEMLDSYRGSLYNRFKIHTLAEIPEDRFILVQLIDDTILDMKVGIILP